MKLNWKDGFEIRVSADKDEVLISANKAGLLSLASHLITLAQQEGRDHFHLDQYNALEKGSAELIIEKTE